MFQDWRWKGAQFLTYIEEREGYRSYHDLGGKGAPPSDVRQKPEGPIHTKGRQLPYDSCEGGGEGWPIVWGRTLIRHK